jgi:hypothetical protein
MAELRKKGILEKTMSDWHKKRLSKSRFMSWDVKLA